ncbi:MAG: hypothetical protein ACRER5_16260 [Pseudomonas sp.]
MNDLAPELSTLASLPAGDIKRKGWKSIVAAAQEAVVPITNHGKPEVIVMSVERYMALAAIAADTDPLQLLRNQFDERLDILRGKGVEGRLKNAFGATTEEMAKTADSPLLAG